MMKDLKYLFFIVILAIKVVAVDYVDDIKDAEGGGCYKKVYIPAKYIEKEELVEVEKPSKKVIVKDPKFKKIKKKIIVVPSYVELRDQIATFEKKVEKFPTNEKKIFYTIGKSKDIPLSSEFVSFIKRKGVGLDSLKVGECYEEYVRFAHKRVVKKSYTKKQAYEILDIEPVKFETIKKKIEIKPAYTKIVKTPAVYETKIIKVLIKPEKKEFITKKDGTVCVVKKPAVYRDIVKKIMKTPPLTKVIKFPPVYKEVEVKKLVKKSVLTRQIISEKKGTYDFYVDDGKDKYIWAKEGSIKDLNKTGLKICKKEREIKYIEKSVEVVSNPATTKKVKVSQKSIELDIEELVSDANSSTVKLPAQYEKIKSQVLLSPSKIIWKKVECKK